MRLWDLCQQTLQSGGGIQLVLVESACMCVVLEGPPHTAVRDSSPAFKIVALYLLFQGSSCAAQYACTLHLLVNGVCVIFDSLLCCRPSASKAACVQLWNLRLSTLEVSNTLFLGSVGCCTVRANTSCLAERLYMARLWAGCALGDRVSSVHDCKASACSSCCASRGLRGSTDLHFSSLGLMCLCILCPTHLKLSFYVCRNACGPVRTHVGHSLRVCGGSAGGQGQQQLPAVPRQHGVWRDTACGLRG